MLRRLFGRGEAPAAPEMADAGPSRSSRVPMTDTPADARRARPREWNAYLDARAASLHALRAGDVATAATKAADSRRLHAAWRGYDYEASPFAAPTTFQTPDLQLVGLSDPSAVRVELAIGAVGPSVDAVDQAKRLIGVTMIDDLGWPWFEEWRGWFAERNSAPPMWDEALLLDSAGPSDEDVQFRDRIRPLGVDERIALAFGGHGVQIDLLAEDLCLTVDATRSISTSLAQHGLATYPASRPSRLARALTVDQLKALAAAKGIIVKGKKDAIAAAVADHVDEPELERLAPGEFVELAGMPRTRWMTYRRAFIELWAHTMMMSGFKLREIRDASDMRDILKGYTIIGDDQCPHCRTKNGARIRLQDVKPETFPPFHPGCRCATAPWGKWE